LPDGESGKFSRHAMDFCEWMKNVELICPSGRRDLRHQGRAHGCFHLISAGLSHRNLWFYAPSSQGMNVFANAENTTQPF